MTRILVADDEPINLMIIAECLSDEGYEIDQANDGEEAWAMMANKHYDLLILDRMMPRLDGLTLLHRIKAEPAWKNTPVIMQTAASSPTSTAPLPVPRTTRFCRWANTRFSSTRWPRPTA